MEHSLHLLGELKATFNLEFCKHPTFCIIRYRAIKEEATS
jgi:hypothetical protein